MQFHVFIISFNTGFISLVYRMPYTLQISKKKLFVPSQLQCHRVHLITKTQHRIFFDIVGYDPNPAKVSTIRRGRMLLQVQLHPLSLESRSLCYSKSNIRKWRLNGSTNFNRNLFTPLCSDWLRKAAPSTSHAASPAQLASYLTLSDSFASLLIWSGF